MVTALTSYAAFRPKSLDSVRCARHCQNFQSSTSCERAAIASLFFYDAIYCFAEAVTFDTASQASLAEFSHSNV